MYKSSSSITQNEMFMPDSEMVFFPGKKKTRNGDNCNGIVSKTAMKATPEFREVMAKERPVAISCYLFFLIFSPFVFRYALYSGIESVSNQISLPELDATTTISVNTTWQHCNECFYGGGVTISDTIVKVKNVTNPSNTAYPPTIAMFASSDLKTWFNFYSPKTSSDMLVKNYSSFTFPKFSEEQGLACLGPIFHNYLVVCLNNKNLASTYQLGQIVPPPPFNDRCFQLATSCGVPCMNLALSFTSKLQYPPNCIPQKNQSYGHVPLNFLVSNQTQSIESDE